MTEKEIIQALRCGEDANGTPRPEPSDGEIVCYDPLKLAAADLIERLTAENAVLREKQAEAEAERDAAIVDLKIFAGCSACRHCCDHRLDHQESLLLTCCDCTKKQNCKCGSCSLGRSNWEWRGLPEAQEEGGKADA